LPPDLVFKSYNCTEFDFEWSSAPDSTRELTAIPQSSWLKCKGFTFKERKRRKERGVKKKTRRRERKEKRKEREKNRKKGKRFPVHISGYATVFDNLAKLGAEWMDPITQGTNVIIIIVTC